MKLLIFSLLLCLGASLKGQDSKLAAPGSGVPSCFISYPASRSAEMLRIACPDTPQPLDDYGQPFGQPLGKEKTHWLEGWLCGYEDCTAGQKCKPVEFHNCREMPDDVSSGPAPSEDVPAIQEKRESPFIRMCEHFHTLRDNLVQCDDPPAPPDLVWTCADPHNYALLTSVDGTNRVCHRISQ